MKNLEKNGFNFDPNKLAAHYSKRKLKSWLKALQKDKAAVTPCKLQKMGAIKAAILFIASSEAIQKNKELLNTPTLKKKG